MHLNTSIKMMRHPQTVEFYRLNRSIPIPFLLFSLCVPQNSLAQALAADEPLLSVSECHTNTSDTALTQQPTLREDKEPLETEEIVVESEYAEAYEDGRMKLRGEVSILHPKYSASADRAELDQTSGIAELDGSVHLSSPMMDLYGESAKLDLDSNQAEILEASFAHKDSQFQGKATAIERESTQRALIKDGMVTTCDVNDPAWAIRASEIELDQETGFGQAYHTRFEVLDVPVLYVPWFTFPIDDRRKTGFLYPTFGTSNTGSGMFLSTPYYLNIAPQADATYIPTAINGRGLHHELEARHLSQFASTKIGFGYIDADEAFEDEERWGFNLKQSYDFSSFDSAWQGRVQYASVSDGDYLEDLNQNLQVGNQTELDRRAFFSWTRDQIYLDFQLQSFENIEDNRSPRDEAFQRLPEINLEAYETAGVFDIDWQSQFVYFHRDPDDLEALDRTHGSRLRHNPKVSLPFQTTWGYFRPAVELDHTDYYLRENIERTNHISRTVAFYELDSGIYFDRDVSYFGQSYHQTLEPRLYYVFSEFEDQSQFPNFDVGIPSFSYQRLFTSHRFSGGDRVGDNNRVTTGVSIRWIEDSSGLEKFVLSLANLTHLERPRLGLNNGVSGTGLNSVRGSDGDDSYWATEVQFRPDELITMSWSGLWNEDLSMTEESVTKLSMESPQASKLEMNHRFRGDGIEQSDVRMTLPVSTDIRTFGRWRYDLTDNRTIGTLVGLEYKSCCWLFEIAAQRYLNSDSEIDHQILIKFGLLGLGASDADAGFENSLLN